MAWQRFELYSVIENLALSSDNGRIRSVIYLNISLPSRRQMMSAPLPFHQSVICGS